MALTPQSESVGFHFSGMFPDTVFDIVIQNKKSESKAYPALLWQGMRTESILSVSPFLIYYIGVGHVDEVRERRKGRMADA